MKKPETKLREARELLEAAWGVIANAGDGNWKLETVDWQGAARRWREKYFAFEDARRDEEGK